MEIVVLGNGILGLSTARALLRSDSGLRLKIVGPADQKGCASLAAAAMFNSFAELEMGTLSNKIERAKWLFNKSATPFWPRLLEDLSTESGLEIASGFGTFILNNHLSDELEDENFDAITAGLEEFGEPFERVSPRAIPKYSPASAARAARAIFIPGEGWVNPIHLIESLKIVLKNSGRVEFIDDYCASVRASGGRIEVAVLASGREIGGDVFLLSPGAAFSKIIAASNLETSFPRVFYGVGCSLLLNTQEDTLTNCIRTPNRGLACGVYSAPQSPTETLLGASNLISPEPIDFGRITSVYTLLKSAMEQINTALFRREIIKINVGWRPTSEDTLPLIGNTSYPNLFVATGTKRDGLHCSPVISRYLSDLILTGGCADFNLDLFKPERRPIRFLTREEAIETAVRHTMNAHYQHDFVPAKNRMTEDLEAHCRADLKKLHDQVGAHDWGIPAEMVPMFRYGHCQI